MHFIPNRFRVAFIESRSSLHFINIWETFIIIIIIIIIIIYHDFLPTPRRGSHVKSSKTHTQSSRYTP